MIKFLIMNVIKSLMKQNDAQLRLDVLIGKKKEDYIKLTLPKSYVPILEVIAMYGIKDSEGLEKILRNHYIDLIKSMYPKISTKRFEGEIE